MKHERIMELINHLEPNENEINTLLESIYEKQMAKAPDFTSQVEMYFHAQTKLENVSLNSTAGHFQMSASTLCRKLKYKNTRFKQLLIDERKRRFRYYLEGDVRNGVVISGYLGFSGPAYFYQLVKHWTGMTFTEIKRNMKINQLDIDRIFNVQQDE